MSGDTATREAEMTNGRALALMEEARRAATAEESLQRLPVPHALAKGIAIALTILGIYTWQKSMPLSWWTVQDVAQGLYYLPVLLAAMVFGLPGAVLAAALAASLTGWQVYNDMGGDFFGACLCRTGHIILLIGTSLGAGWLFDTSMLARRRAELARDKLNEASRLLMDTSGRLVQSLQKLQQATLNNRTTEEQLRRAERLNALGKLSAGLAHEIRNPLASIRGSAEILGDRASNDPLVMEFVGILKQETERLNEVLTRFLNFAQSGRNEPGQSNPKDVLEEVLALIRRQADQARVLITTDVAPGLPSVGLAPIHLRQVLLNLLLNAVQSMCKCTTERRVHVALVPTPPAEGDSVPPGRGRRAEVRIVVGDTGPGIAPELAARVFDPFFTTRNEGTGLGLAIVDRIVRDVCGQIMLLPLEERGTVQLPAPLAEMCGACFVIDLPAHSEGSSGRRPAVDPLLPQDDPC